MRPVCRHLLDTLRQTIQEIVLADVPQVARQILEGTVRGRTVVNVNG